MFYQIYLLLVCFTFFSGTLAYAMMEDEEASAGQTSGVFQTRQEQFPTPEGGKDNFHTVVTGLRFDLHGQSLKNAKDSVMDLIPALYNLNANEVHFICGRGNHVNKNGKRAVIWKAMPTWLSDPSMTPFIDSYKKGLGTYNVILKSPTGDSVESERLPLKTDVIEKLAEAGNAEAQLVLAELHIEGKFIKQNYKTAVLWLKRAADKDLGQAQFRLGYMTAMGKGVIYNPEEAIKWYERAGERGVSNGYLNIGIMYYVGEGVEQNYKTSYLYHLRAAKLGNPKAFNLLGIMTRRGLGVHPSDEVAVLWDQKGAEVGEPHAMVNLGCMLIEGRGIVKNEAEGAKWLKKAAEFGIAEGQLRYGLLCKDGTGVSQDYEQAAIWINRAAATGSGSIVVDAQCLLYELIRTKKIKPSGIDEARKLLEAAVKNNHPAALFELGHHYRMGSYGFPQNEEKAKEYYLKASTYNHGGALYALFDMYSLGQDKDEEKASFYLNKAAQLGYPMALVLKGQVPPDIQRIIQEAQKWS